MNKKKLLLVPYGSSTKEYLEAEGLIEKTEVLHCEKGEWSLTLDQQIKATTKELVVVVMLDLPLFNELKGNRSRILEDLSGHREAFEIKVFTGEYTTGKTIDAACPIYLEDTRTSIDAPYQSGLLKLCAA